MKTHGLPRTILPIIRFLMEPYWNRKLETMDPGERESSGSSRPNFRRN